MHCAKNNCSEESYLKLQRQQPFDKWWIDVQTKEDRGTIERAMASWKKNGPVLSTCGQVFPSSFKYSRKRGRIEWNAVVVYRFYHVRIIYVWSQMWPGIRLFSYVEWKRSWKMANKSSFKAGIVATIFQRTYHFWTQVYKLSEDFFSPFPFPLFPSMGNLN